MSVWLVKDLLLGCRLLVMSSHCGMGRDLSTVSYKGTYPIDGLCQHDLITSQSAHLFTPSLRALGFNIPFWGGGGQKHTDPWVKFSVLNLRYSNRYIVVSYCFILHFPDNICNMM